ncbi:MAG: hypothetical protein AB7G11_05905 [Phycisphaerales bacterium]
MITLFAIALAISYFWGCGRLIRWGCRRADQPEPTWFDIIGMLMLPAVARRATMWMIPDDLNWPEKWIAGSMGLVVLFLVLWAYFKIRVLDAALIWILVLVLATLMLVQIMPYVAGKA